MSVSYLNFAARRVVCRCYIYHFLDFIGWTTRVFTENSMSFSGSWRKCNERITRECCHGYREEADLHIKMLNRERKKEKGVRISRSVSTEKCLLGSVEFRKYRGEAGYLLITPLKTHQLWPICKPHYGQFDHDFVNFNPFF